MVEGGGFSTPKVAASALRRDVMVDQTTKKSFRCSHDIRNSAPPSSQNIVSHIGVRAWISTARLPKVWLLKRSQFGHKRDVSAMPNKTNNNVSDQKARLTLGVIMGTFLVCWLPFFLMNIWHSWSPGSINHSVVAAVTWLGYANSTANPLIYSIFNRDFRRAFGRILAHMFHCHRDHNFNESITPYLNPSEIEFDRVQQRHSNTPSAYRHGSGNTCVLSESCNDAENVNEET
ncbi:hypothetical protein ANCCAN_14696 [Ancylostoma caninum]|uniref:G-protein coupled receptors family 1 profile domain-containing protein n=1 Tax=Ancylostoma caninum TaxID=29170 RepID=A0A368G4V9_ANCCA|nr:hypothetical protein ANCCAN_14696 [Ancylostoma caninum]